MMSMTGDAGPGGAHFQTKTMSYLRAKVHLESSHHLLTTGPRVVSERFEGRQ